MINHLLNETINILRPTNGKDEGGSNIKDYNEYLSNVFARVQPVKADENVIADRKKTKRTYKIYVDVNTSVRQIDRVEYEDSYFEIQELITYPKSYTRLIVREV